MNYKSLFITIFLFGFTNICLSDNYFNSDTITRQKVFSFSDTLVSAEQDTIINDTLISSMLDSLVSHNYFDKISFNSDTAYKNKYNFSEGEIPKYSDSVYYERIYDLDVNTPIKLEYNFYVKNFINLYAVRKRKLTSKVLGLSKLYFPMIEAQLDRFDMPLELKYLAIVESALNPNARSRAGATGMWQFMYATGKEYGLKVSSFVDDRRDPYESTVAACRHLKDLYNIYHDWLLAMAAYNSGGGNVNKAIRRSGGKRNFWAIRRYLPRETRSYVAAFIAVNYVMNYYEEHNIRPTIPSYIDYTIDTVTITDVLSFKQISEKINVPVSELKFFNPSFKKGIIPAIKNKKYILRLPSQYINAYVDVEKDIYNYETKKGLNREKVLAEIKKFNDRQIHRVRRGENLGIIARRYHCSVRNLKSWNNLRSNLIRPGQKIVIYPRNYSYHSKKSRSKSTYKDSKYLYYIVRKGDTLWDIANKYKGVTITKIKRLNNIRNAKSLKPGQKIKIAVIAG
ncbi:MAG: LysM peptidoglycan-binding domain-containing protein [Bacteroidales bacterium]|nr:LysM peptidoglycan-binding domain-containing protein [Bacteroidales bacterium]